MNENENSTALLSEIYRNLSVGSENLGNLIPKIKDKFLMQNVTGQMERYSAFAEETAALMKQQGLNPPKISAAEKFLMRGGAMINTMFDSSDRHIAALIEKGTKMGAQALESTLLSSKNINASPTAIDLARKVADFERTEAYNMRDFI